MAASPSPAPQPVPSASAGPADETLVLKVYFLMHDPRELEFLVPVERSVPQTEAVAAAAMRELLVGPTDDEQSGRYPGRTGQLASLSTAVPAGTKLLSIDIHDGIATVDLSGEFRTGDEIGDFVYRQAQIVYTLTQFPTVEGVAFRIEGEPAVIIEGHEATNSTGPATRELYFDQRRSVFVDDPAWGAPVGDMIRVTGETTSESELRFALIDGATDRILAEQTVRAACDPCMAPDAWGPFEARLSLPVGPLPSDVRLRIWEPPYMEGRPTIAFDYPLG